MIELWLPAIQTSIWVSIINFQMEFDVPPEQLSAFDADRLHHRVLGESKSVFITFLPVCGLRNSTQLETRAKDEACIRM